MLWKLLKFGSSKVYAGSRGMPGLSLHTWIERFQKELLFTAVCCRQSDGMLKAVSNALVSLVSSHWRKL